MYLPALPLIAADLPASPGATQMTLMVFFVSFGVFQLAFGPVSDTSGRKPPLYFGLGVFAIGGIGCWLAPNIEWLIFFRIVQGMGAASVAVIPRAVIRDLYTGVEATRLMALVMLVFSVSPILAPLAGSAIIVPFGWRAVFVTITIVAGAGVVPVSLFLPETRPPEERVKFSWTGLTAGFGVLLRDRRFLGLTFIGGLGMASFFTFLASSSFVYMDHFGLTPTQYSVTFSVNAIGFVGSAQLAARLGGRFGIGRTVSVAVSIYAAITLLLFVVTAVGVDNLAVLMTLLFFAFANLGLVIPTTMILALDEHGPIAGTASALGGTLQFLTGAVAIAVSTLFFDGTAMPMVAVIAATAAGAFVLTRLTLRKPDLSAEPAE